MPQNDPSSSESESIINSSKYLLFIKIRNIFYLKNYFIIKYMLKFKNINLANLSSELINNIDGNTEELSTSLILTTKQLNDFNNRIINPENLNKVIEIFDYFLIDDIEKFIIYNSIPTKQTYYIEEQHQFKLNLPNFMTNKIDCSEIAQFNCLNWLKFAHENNYEWDENTTYNSAENGSLECLKYLIENKCPINIDSLNIIVQKNNLNCLIYFNEIQIIKFTKKLVEIASQYGSLDCLKYLHSINITHCEFNNDICTKLASKNGHIDILKYLQKNNYYFSTETFINAKNLEIMKYLHKISCPWSHLCYKNSIDHNNIDEIIFLCYNKCPFNESVSQYCAEKNNFKILKFLYENGCSWNKNVVKNAAINNNFEMFKYAIENGCPPNLLNENICDYITHNSNFHMLVYAINKRFSFGSNTARLAAKFGNLDILRLLHLNNCNWDETVANCAAKYGQLDCLVYCMENGCPIGNKIHKFILNNKTNDKLSYNRYLCFRYIMKKAYSNI